MDRPLSSWRQPDSEEESPSEPVEQKEAPKADAAPHDDAAFACLMTTDTDQRTYESHPLSYSA